VNDLQIGAPDELTLVVNDSSRTTVLVTANCRTDVQLPSLGVESETVYQTHYGSGKKVGCR
jgi:hypothetical protein